MIEPVVIQMDGRFSASTVLFECRTDGRKDHSHAQIWFYGKGHYCLNCAYKQFMKPFGAVERVA